MIDVICLGSLYGLIDSQIDSTSSVQRRNLIICMVSCHLNRHIHHHQWYDRARQHGLGEKDYLRIMLVNPKSVAVIWLFLACLLLINSDKTANVSVLLPKITGESSLTVSFAGSSFFPLKITSLALFIAHPAWSRIVSLSWGRLYKTLNHFFNHYFVVK